MAQFFETSKDIADLAQEKWENTGLAQTLWAGIISPVFSMQQGSP